MVDNKKVYIAGPMRGYIQLNWPAFDQAAQRWREGGWKVVNPADIDRECGLSPDAPFTQSDVNERFRADLIQIASCDAIAVLSGWQLSTLAPVEVAAARGCGMPVYDANSNPLAPTVYRESVLAEANRLTAIERHEDYGHPSEDFARAATIINAVLGLSIQPKDVAMLMICIKMARQAHRPKRDNIVDICGYARTYDMIEEKEGV